MMSSPDRRFVLAALSALGLAGCGGGPPPATFDLAAARPASRGGRVGIVVPEPTAIFALDSERIVVRAASGEMAYLPRAQWSDKLPRLVQTRLVQSFENAGRAAVGRPADRLAGGLSLLIDIRAFEVREATRDASIEMAAKLVASATGSVRASRLFVASAPVSTIDGAGSAQALNDALARVLVDIVGWARD